MKLSQQQKDFISQAQKITWVGIALLDEEQEHIVFGKEVIKTVESNRLVGCVEYHFQLDRMVSNYKKLKIKRNKRKSSKT